MLPIQPDQTFKFTCGSCGTLVVPLLKGVPDLIGKSSHVCSECSKTVCDSCYNKSKKVCNQCINSKGGWCKTPELPPGPLL
ncbi:MAG TPA: hypothetical protein V6C72_08380 [Chroococcales cyanobacterium]